MEERFDSRRGCRLMSFALLVATAACGRQGDQTGDEPTDNQGEDPAAITDPAAAGLPNPEPGRH